MEACSPTIPNPPVEHAVFECLKLMKEPPRRILIVGGCRQQPFSQLIALNFPGVGISLVDSDAEITAAAEAKIHCRFQFVHSDLKQLPFEDSRFDLTLALNLFEQVTPEDWEATMAEIARVTQKHFLIGVHQPGHWFDKLYGKFQYQLIGHSEAALSQAWGLAYPEQQPSSYDQILHLYRYGRVQKHLDVYPWRFWMMKMLPIRESRLVLSQ